MALSLAIQAQAAMDFVVEQRLPGRLAAMKRCRPADTGLCQRRIGISRQDMKAGCGSKAAMTWVLMDSYRP